MAALAVQVLHLQLLEHLQPMQVVAAAVITLRHLALVALEVAAEALLSINLV
jgi:hypothetical protein